MLFLIFIKYLRQFKAIIGSLPVKKRQIQWYQKWPDSTKLRYDEVISGFRSIPFFGRSSPYPNTYAFPNVKRQFNAVLCDKNVTSGIGKGR